MLARFPAGEWPCVAEIVLGCLSSGWLLEQAAGWLGRQKFRILVLSKQPNKKAKTNIDQLLALLEPLDPLKRKTIVFDNHIEFAQHLRLNRQHAMQTFGCDTHSPWRKAGVENLIGRSGATCQEQQTSPI